ncbi:MAG TPA: GNAT family N-acetyltransferase [Actinomycetota bacterium]|nr:GNAT family N-acetyltransferase [Actinomycetota bacterium]
MNAEHSASIRDAQEEDAEAIARVHISCWQEAYSGQLPDELLAGLPNTIARRTDFWGQVAAEAGPRDVLMVAEENDKVIGFAHARESRDEGEDDSVAEITAIYLRKRWWDQGIGRALFSEATDRLKAAGFTSAMLWVLETNTRTRRFYEAAGWELDGGTKSEKLGPATVREVRYRRALS